MDKDRISFMLTVEDIARIKREGAERDSIRDETFCRLLKNLGYKFYRDDYDDRISGAYNVSTMESVEFAGEEAYAEWLENMRKSLKPWVDNLAEGIIQSNRDVIFMVDFSECKFRKLYNASSKKGWDSNPKEAMDTILEICEEHEEELEEGQMLYIADRIDGKFEPKYLAYYDEGVQGSDSPYKVLKVSEVSKRFFDSAVN